MIRRAAFGRAFGVAEAKPIRGFVRSAGKARVIDKSLQEKKLFGKNVLPIAWQHARRKRQRFGGEMLNANPRQNQEAHVVGDAV